METRSAAVTAGVPRTRLDFAYDAEGRRTSKTVLTNWSGSVYQATNLTRFIYDPGIQTGGGWNLLAEVNRTNKVLRSYVWGLDLTGALETDGNVGGLLMVVDHTGGSPTCHFAAYDGNGNLMALVKTDQTVAARYEYGPFGEPIRLTGPLAKVNPFRWSTKFTDEESGLVDYGYRLYSPSLGRWISRDPIEELGGLNVYAMCQNALPNAVDTNGRETLFGLQVSTGMRGIIAAAVFGGHINALLSALMDKDDNWFEAWRNGFLVGAIAGAAGGVPGAIIGKETTFSAFLSYVLGGTISGGMSAAGGAALRGRNPLDGDLGTGQMCLGAGIGAAVGIAGFGWSLGFDEEQVLDVVLAVAAGFGDKGGEVVSAVMLP